MFHHKLCSKVYIVVPGLYLFQEEPYFYATLKNLISFLASSQTVSHVANQERKDKSF